MKSSRKALAVVIFLLSNFPAAVLCEPASEEVDWDKIETRLFWDMKEAGGKSDAEIHQAIGVGLLRADDQWERATYHFEHAVKLDPGLHWSWYNLGVIYIDTEEGNEFFKKAIEAKPDFAPPYYWLAYNCAKGGSDKDSLSLFEKYVEVAKQDPDEKNRVRFAKKALKELRSGMEGESLRSIRASARAV